MFTCLCRLGQGACLVYHEGIDLADFLEGGGIFDEDILLCRLADAYHQGRGCGESHRTGTGDDQYADGREDGLGQTVGAADEEPEQEGEQADAYDGRYEDEGYLVDGALYGGF